MSFQPPPIDRPRGWWSRNWKWAVPIFGCGGIIVLGALFVGGIAALLFGAMKTSDVYKEAVAEARGDARVIETLGTPIEEGWFVRGNISVENDSGKADLIIPLKGPKGKGDVYAKATKERRKWQFESLVFTPDDNGPEVDLLR
jgi:hypothetical protein